MTVATGFVATVMSRAMSSVLNQWFTRCHQCKKYLSTDNFDKKKNKQDYYTRCKPCRLIHNKYNKERYTPKPIYTNIYKMSWYESPMKKFSSTNMYFQDEEQTRWIYERCLPEGERCDIRVVRVKKGSREHLVAQ